MVDLLGPASLNAVTVRPPEDRTIGVDDTYWKDCTSSEAQDGTRLKAAFFNNVLMQLRRAIRGMGIGEDNADDDMLLKAIKKAGASSVAQAAASQPTHFEILTGNAVFAFTPTTNQVVINAAQGFVHRGLNAFSTDQFTVPARTFALTPNKTYHVRWHAPGTGSATPIANYPNGRFLCNDLADGVYNPGAAAESSPNFDGSYDNALLARVVTDGAGTPTVTALVNKAKLDGYFQDGFTSYGAFAAGTSPTPTGSPRIIFTLNDAAGTAASRFTHNWARTPVGRSANAGVGVLGFATDAGHAQGTSNYVASHVTTRYQTDLVYYSDFDQSVFSGGSMNITGAYGFARLSVSA